jgi:hypothetical protein
MSDKISGKKLLEFLKSISPKKWICLGPIRDRTPQIDGGATKHWTITLCAAKNGYKIEFYKKYCGNENQSQEPNSYTYADFLIRIEHNRFKSALYFGTYSNDLNVVKDFTEEDLYETFWVIWTKTNPSSKEFSIEAKWSEFKQLVEGGRFWELW